MSDTRQKVTQQEVQSILKNMRDTATHAAATIRRLQKTGEISKDNSISAYTYNLRKTKEYHEILKSLQELRKKRDMKNELEIFLEQFDKLTLDSRQISKNTVFIAYPGMKFDGRDFIEQAVNNGANGIVFESENYKKKSEKKKILFYYFLSVKIVFVHQIVNILI